MNHEKNFAKFQKYFLTSPYFRKSVRVLCWTFENDWRKQRAKYKELLKFYPDVNFIQTDCESYSSSSLAWFSVGVYNNQEGGYGNKRDAYNKAGLKFGLNGQIKKLWELQKSFSKTDMKQSHGFCYFLKKWNEIQERKDLFACPHNEQFLPERIKNQTCQNCLNIVNYYSGLQYYSCESEFEKNMEAHLFYLSGFDWALETNDSPLLQQP